jgi:hypothetical protein
VDLGSGGFAFLGDALAYREQRLPFRRADLEGLEAGYKRAVTARAPYEYVDSDWLETAQPTEPWSGYARRIRGALGPAMKHRAALNAVYADRLPAAIQLAPRYQNWRFNVRVPDSRRALEAIFADGLFASAHFPSLQGVMGNSPAPHAEALGREALNLFNDHRFSLEQAEKVCGIVAALS